VSSTGVSHSDAYLTVLEVLVVHDRMIEEFGGASGVRDAGALEAALYRPVTGYYDDVVAQAAALLEGLLVNHAFVDGNKRVAFAVADVFLRLNGFLIATSTDDAHDVIIEALASGGDRFDRLDAWLRDHVEELP
jgi:death on curing protein